MIQLKKHNTSFKGLYILEMPHFQDNRGTFQKTFSFDQFKALGLNEEVREVYYSISAKNVIRGMHFQIPPYDHTKIVYVSNGKILDVSIDLRKDSSTYGKSFSVELNSTDGKFVLIPSGFAHGFASLEDNTIINSCQTSCYNSEADYGINSLSINFNWPVTNPIRSNHDINLPNLSDFISPF